MAFLYLALFLLLAVLAPVLGTDSRRLSDDDSDRRGWWPAAPTTRV